MMKNKIVLAVRLVCAVILLQTLYFKFSGAPESIFIFSKLGIEPWGRWFAGISELVASILLVVPATQLLGALMATAIMVGAIASHLAVLGIVVQDDGGLLFGLACGVLLGSIVVLLARRDQIPIWVSRARRLLNKQNGNRHAV
jgi:uncharacterized membrane protein YphA (DoxX/SURF4 family)